MNFRESPYLVEVFDFDLLNLQLNTPLFIFGLVLVVMFFLQRWLFQPVLATLDARQAKLDAWKQQAQQYRQEAGEVLQSCEERLGQMRSEAAQARQAQAKGLEAEVHQLLDQAGQEAQAQFTESVRALQQDVQQAKGALEGNADTLAEQLRARLLGR